jgi:hypothetical protein
MSPLWALSCPGGPAGDTHARAVVQNTREEKSTTAGACAGPSRRRGCTRQARQ